MRYCRYTAVASMALVATGIGAQTPSDSAGKLHAKGLAAYQAKDYSSFTALERQAHVLNPQNPRWQYNIACGEALQGHADPAVAMLDSLLARKLDLGAATDADFTAIHTTPAWAEFTARLATLHAPLTRSTVAFTVPDRGFMAAGIAVDPATRDIYVASVRERKIIRWRPGGAITDFTTSAQDGFLAGASLAIDASRHLLYATTASVSFMTGYQPADVGRSGVFAFDLSTGKTVRHVLLPPDGKHHFLNGLVVDRTGNVYITDSRESGIYLLRPGSDQLEVFVSPSAFTAAQGVAFSADEQTLYVVDWSDGLWTLDMRTKTRHKVQAPPDTWLAGLDGLTRVGDAFVTVQIGVQPSRVLRLYLNPSGTSISKVETLEMSRSEYDGPIQGSAEGESEFLYVANSQLELANDETGAFAADKARPTVVLRLPVR